MAIRGMPPLDFGDRADFAVGPRRPRRPAGAGAAGTAMPGAAMGPAAPTRRRGRRGGLVPPQPRGATTRTRRRG
jgi:hypothetical protein